MLDYLRAKTLPAMASICLILALLSGVLYWQVQSGRGKLADAQEALQREKANSAILAKEVAAVAEANAEYRNTIEALAAKEVKERVIIRKAVEANPDWASGAIPADVIAGLQSKD